MTLPQISKLVEHLEDGCSFDDIALDCGVPKQEILERFREGSAGKHEKPFLERASTALCLIRAGVNTTDQLKKRLGYKSSSAVRNHVRKLTERGWVVEDEGLCGTLRLTDEGRQMVSHITLRLPDRWSLGKSAD